MNAVISVSNEELYILMAAVGVRGLSNFLSAGKNSCSDLYESRINKTRDYDTKQSIAEDGRSRPLSPANCAKDSCMTGSTEIYYLSSKQGSHAK